MNMKKEKISEAESIRLWQANAEAWTELTRMGFDICRDHLNMPNFLSILPSVTGKEGLDIGCGEGANTRAVAALGCRMTAVDPCSNFVSRAGDPEDNGTITFIEASATQLPFSSESFDFAISTMCLMDLPDLDRAFAEAFRVLKPGGFFQFSIVHPCFNLPGNYFEEGPYEEKWTFSSVPAELKEKHGDFKVAHYHRPLSTWLNLLIGSGFCLEAMLEPRPTEEAVARFPHLAEARELAWFLHIRARKPGNNL